MPDSVFPHVRKWGKLFLVPHARIATLTVRYNKFISQAIGSKFNLPGVLDSNQNKLGKYLRMIKRHLEEWRYLSQRDSVLKIILLKQSPPKILHSININKIQSFPGNKFTPFYYLFYVERERYTHARTHGD